MVGRPQTTLRRALALLMAGLWVWVFAEAAWLGATGHHHKATSSGSPSCGVCTIALGLLETFVEGSTACEPPAVPTQPLQFVPPCPQKIFPALPHGRAPPAAALP